MRRTGWLLGCLAGAVLLLTVSWLVKSNWRLSEVTGTVTNSAGPVAGAVVRLKATSFETRTDSNGHFLLVGFAPRFDAQITAWSDGHYISGATAYPWGQIIAIHLTPYGAADNETYAWVPPKVHKRTYIQEALARWGLPVAARISFNHLFLPLASRLPLGCADCHGKVISSQFEGGAHAKGTDNFIFKTAYSGTDVHGNRSALTSYGFSRDYGRFPMRSDTTQPWYGPGFKLDFPDQAGNCANCHMPGVAVGAPDHTDVEKLPAGAVQGTHCDFCHKMAYVTVDNRTGVPPENMTGVLSIELRRPEKGDQVFFGPLDDVDVGPDTYLPLQNESLACAPCHNASFWGTPVYQSYSEWLNSPYPAEGKTCQKCHMKTGGLASNFAPGHGGSVRDSDQIFAHDFPGAADVNLLQDTAKLEVVAERRDGKIDVEVRVTNENAGHDIPTDHPMRNVILVIDATDSAGLRLTYAGNQTVPNWGGVGTDPRDYAGLPGKGYAKILEELWTETSPTIAYWRQTRIKEDTRIAARETDVTLYQFEAPGTGEFTIGASLIFRRAFKQLADVKAWDIADILMEHETVTIH